MWHPLYALVDRSSTHKGRVVTNALLFREFLRHPAAVGSICASSVRLANRVARHVDLKKPGCIVELGGGTGALTTALLRRGVPEHRLIVIEKSGSLALYLRDRFPMVRIVRGDAAHIDLLLDPEERINSIVSGLPLCSQSSDIVQGITGACSARLPKGGRVVQFSYVWGRESPWLNAGMERLRTEVEWINIPPARVEVLGRSWR